MTFLSPRHRLCAIALVATLLAAFAFPAGAQPQEKKDFSAAERLLFMTNQLAPLRPPTTLNYSFRKSGSMEEGFEDKVSIALSKLPDGSCCSGVGEFLSGPRKLNLPEVPAAEGNPVILYFLEHDVREMQRLTKGSQYHFRKRIRMAVYDSAKVREASFAYRGKTVKGTEVEISPFLTDPNRPRYEKLAAKQYLFMLSDAVPGGVYGIRTSISDAAQPAALIVEELYAEGAEPAPRKNSP